MATAMIEGIGAATKELWRVEPADLPASTVDQKPAQAVEIVETAIAHAASRVGMG